MSRCIEGQLVSVPVGDARSRLHLRVVNERGRVPVFKNKIRCPETFLNIAAPRAHRLRLILGIERKIALGPDLHGIGLQRLFGFKDETENFIINLDQTEGFIRDVPVHRSDRCYRIANEPHRIVEHVTPVLGNLLDIVIVL